MHHLSGHPHVITFKGAYEDDKYVHIVMELCTGACACVRASRRACTSKILAWLVALESQARKRVLAQICICSRVCGASCGRRKA